MTEQDWLANHFLIAMPKLMDPNFFHSVTYICEHNEKGAMGIVINQPVNMNMRDLVEHLDIETVESERLDQPVFRGGPVETERGFVIHRPLGKWESTLQVTDEIGISTSNDIVAALADDTGPSEYLIALGYAGWEAGQLEQEMIENAWLSGPADTNIIFESKVNTRWEEAAALLGVDITQISSDSGHA
jgi:putative transcriptional regulator